MLIINHSHTHPAFNLACEDYFFDNAEQDVFILWRNEPSVIIGRNQNALAEIDFAYTQREGIHIVRRQTGGGAVFHDLGNINYTYIVSDYNGPVDFPRFSQPMIEMLRSIGFPVVLSGRNDLTLDGKKISGAAQRLKNGKLLHHGTLLYSADMSRLAGALRVKPDKYQGRAIPSVASRVMNLREAAAAPLGAEDFKKQLLTACLAHFPDSVVSELSEHDKTAITALADARYRLESWNFGAARAYNVHGQTRCDAGSLEVQLQVEDGVITDLRFFGDFFFSLDSDAVASRLIGLPHRPEAVRAVLDDETIAQAFAGFRWETVIEALF